MKIGAMLGDLLQSFFQSPATERYPLERRDPPKRLRGQLQWNPTQCTGCGLCARDCPANALEMIVLDRADKRFVLRYHLDRCTFCGQCVQSCRFDCLELSKNEWELAALNRETFTISYGDEADVETVLGRSTDADNESLAVV